MPSFGEKLKMEREKRKITLDQISSSTKIGTRMLQALEEDKFDQLPGGIFNKGFVRAYSRCIGLDEDQTVAEYLQASGDGPPVPTEIEAREDGARENAERVSRLEAISDTPARQLPWGLLAAVLLIIALALSLWSHHQRERERPPVQPTPTKPTAQLPATQSSGEGSGGVSGGVSDGMSARVKDTGAASPTPGSPTTNSPTPGSADRGSAPSVAPTIPQDASAAAPGEFTVAIQTREESWISITTDGRTLSSELLPAGSERAIQGRKEIIVKTGNAAGVDFRFNGKKLDTGGAIGEVRTVTFGPRGMSPSAPLQPSTP